MKNVKLPLIYNAFAQIAQKVANIKIDFNILDFLVFIIL
jgi:hypothetical protein